MYLKKYDLSEKVVSGDDIMNIIYAVIGSGNGLYSYTWKRLKNKIKIYSSHVKYNGSPNPCMEILDTGHVIIKESENGLNCWSPSRVEMIANHILFETQWIDPKVELPKVGENVYVKTDKGIILTQYDEDRADSENIDPIFHCSVGIFTDNISVLFIIGWLPADNVVI